MNSVTRVHSTAAPSEIDLFKLVHSVWRRRVLVIGMALLGALIGVSYAYLVTPVYEASTILRPIAINQLDALNRSNIYSLPPAEALKRVGATFDSYNARLDFFRSRPDLIDAFQNEGESLEQAFEDFNRGALTLMQPDPKKADLLSAYVGLKMRYEKGVDGAGILNDFVDFAIERERVQLSKDFQLILANRMAETEMQLNAAVSEYQAGKEGRIARLEEADAIKRAELNDELKALRVQLKLRREARLAQLEEAISIARSLGLKKPSTPSLMADGAVGGGNIIRTEVSSQQTPLYFLGTDVLEAERNTLRKRTSDDFVEPRIAQIRKELVMLSTNRKVQMLRARENEAAFLEGIEALRVERARLQAIDTKLDGLHLVSIDQRAVESSKPVKPRKGVIVLVALIAGLVLGAFIALVRGAFKDHLRQMRVLEIEGSAQRVAVGEEGAVNGARLV
ncbi:Wzz/FepE/Etk N-terminal domain-containing protein [Pseudomonas taiwanensis]|uniref:Wzz/FepE/Etk N-terminal domain-containing protein n=1 Tax=Pseudomonas taiwanensis TaxID=470150 RepID=UPI0016470C17|nr:LPS O-antigen chain length determinant protein WzzB [Pseudomonas taiwanensis]